MLQIKIARKDIQLVIISKGRLPTQSIRKADMKVATKRVIPNNTVQKKGSISTPASLNMYTE